MVETVKILQNNDISHIVTEKNRIKYKFMTISASDKKIDFFFKNAHLYSAINDSNLEITETRLHQ